MTYFDYQNNGMSLGGEMPYGMPPERQPGALTDQYGNPLSMDPYNQSAAPLNPQSPPLLNMGANDVFADPAIDNPGEKPAERTPPKANFEKYRDRGLEAGKMYRDVSGDGMSIAQMKQLTQRGQPQYQDFMAGGSGYSGLPYGLLGG